MSSKPYGRKIPHSIQNRLGHGKLEKGTWKYDKNDDEDEQFYLIAWDFAKKCTGEKCPLYHLCDYKDGWMMKKESGVGATSNCMLHQKYLKNVIHAVVQKMKDRRDVTQEGVIKLGYQLLPLYDQLFKFKMWEYSNEELVYVSEKGTPKVHPVYKEIREIIKSISSVWREVGGVDKAPDNPKDVGDISFVDAVSGATGQERKEVADNVSQEGTGIDFDEAEAEAPKRRKKSGKNKKRIREAAAKKRRKDKVTKDVPKYSQYNDNREKDDE